jgi:hypothetical protein
MRIDSRDAKPLVDAVVLLGLTAVTGQAVFLAVAADALLDVS